MSVFGHVCSQAAFGPPFVFLGANRQDGADDGKIFPRAMAKTGVPITPSVLEWAIDESGLTTDQVADAVGVRLGDIEDWLARRATPGVTEARALARVLRRPIAALLLPRPPVSHVPDVRFRATPGVAARQLSPVERRYLRKARRLQQAMAWTAAELGETEPRLPLIDGARTAAAVANAMRVALGLGDDAISWPSASAAFDGWRDRVEGLGVAVLLFAMGKESCRGFSLWDGRAPLIAVNTAWNDEARAFTLFHELGHLTARTNSACTTGDPSAAGAWDPAERWCEEFAAHILLSEPAVRRAVVEKLGPRVERISDIGQIRRVAARFHTSLRATTIRLIDLGFASWDLYHQLPVASDAKRGGGGGKGRDRQEIQEDSLGGRTTRLFVRAVDADVVSRAEALAYLDVHDSALDDLRARA